MTHRRLLPAALLAGPLMAGCAQTGPNEQAGTAAGAVTGAALGYGRGKGHRDQTPPWCWAPSSGAWSDSGSVNSSMRQIRCWRAAPPVMPLEYVPTGISTAWRGPNTGNSGYTVPMRTYEAADGAPCREYSTTVIVG